MLGLRPKSSATTTKRCSQTSNASPSINWLWHQDMSIWGDLENTCSTLGRSVYKDLLCTTFPQAMKWVGICHVISWFIMALPHTWQTRLACTETYNYVCVWVMAAPEQTLSYQQIIVVLCEAGKTRASVISSTDSHYSNLHLDSTKHGSITLRLRPGFVPS